MRKKNLAERVLTSARHIAVRSAFFAERFYRYRYTDIMAYIKINQLQIELDLDLFFFFFFLQALNLQLAHILISLSERRQRPKAVYDI